MQNRKPLLSHQNLNDNNITRWGLPNGVIARFGQGSVLDMAFSLNSEYLAVGTSIGLWWYELATIQPVVLWEAEREMVSAISFSPNGKWIAMAGYDGGIKVWDIQRRVCISQMKRCMEQKSLMHQNEISRLAFSPDNQQLVGSGKRDYCIDIWQPDTGEQLARINSTSQIELRYCSLTRPLAFSPDSRLLACVSPEDANISATPAVDVISVWDTSRWQRLAYLTEYTDFAYSLCFSPCGLFLASGGDVNGTLFVWDTTNWQLLKRLDYGGYRTIPSYSPESVLWAAEISDTAITIWNVDRGEKFYTDHTTGETSGAQFFYGTHLAVNSKRELKVWTVEDTSRSPDPRITLHTHTSCPESQVFSSDGKTLVCATRYHGILLWDVGTISHPPNVFDPPGLRHRIYAPLSEKIYATSQEENSIKVWEVGNKLPVAQIVPESRPTYWGVAFDPNNRCLAYGDEEGSVQVWDITADVKLHTLTKHIAAIARLEFSPNGKYLASFSDYGPDACLWNIENGQEISNFPGDRIETLTFSPCSTLIAADTEKEIIVWDIVRSENRLTICKPRDWIDNGLWQLVFAFSPCKRYFASGACWNLGMERTPVRLWDETGQNITNFWGHTKDIQALAFSPDGTLLASGSLDGTILLWDITPYLTNETP